MPDDNKKPAPGFVFSLTNLKPVESGNIALTFPDGARREFRSEERRVGKECRSRWSPYH